MDISVPVRVAAMVAAAIVSGCSGGGSPGAGGGVSDTEAPSIIEQQTSTIAAIDTAQKAAMAAYSAIESARTIDERVAATSEISEAKEALSIAQEEARVFAAAAAQGTQMQQELAATYQRSAVLLSRFIASLESALATGGSLQALTLDGELLPQLTAPRAASVNAEITWTLRQEPGEGEETPEGYEDFTERVVPVTGFKSLAYEEGKRLFGDGATSDELKMRGITIRNLLLDSIPSDDWNGDGTSGEGSPGDPYRRNKGEDVDFARLTIHGGSQVGSLFEVSATTGEPAAPATGWNNFVQAYYSSIQLPSDRTSGPTLKMGGPGIIFYDMEQRKRAIGCSGTGQSRLLCNDATTDDVTVRFTKAATQDLSGEPTMIWRTRIPFDPAGRNAALFDPETGNLRGSDPRNPESRDRIFDQGEYQLYLSRYAGFDENLEPTTGFASYPSDDAHRHLNYAMYGMFVFMDNGLSSHGPGRVQVFHSGYDAFADSVGSKTTDLTDATAVKGEFNGWTSGWLVRSARALVSYSRDFSTDNTTVNPVGELIRMRGRVVLEASINGNDNQIKGYMKDFEFLNNGVWARDYSTPILQNAPSSYDQGRAGKAVLLVGGDIPKIPSGTSGAGLPNRGTAAWFAATAVARNYDGDDAWADINADGSFSGRAIATHNGPGGNSGFYWFDMGEWGGNLYGPKDELEAAGVWYLPAGNWKTASQSEKTGDVGHLLGSFGAVFEEPPE